MIEKPNEQISMKRQCELVGIATSTLYYKPKPENDQELTLMQQMDTIYTKHPYYGAKRIKHQLQKQGQLVNIKRVRRLMEKMGMVALYPKRNLSKPAPNHKKYPYLLRGMNITECNQVWSTDITYIPLKKGFMYLVAVMDWRSRYVLSWKLSNTMTIEFCKSCLQEAIDNYGSPQIFNSDQGSQFTSDNYINIWKENKMEQVQVSMDGKGRATDNAFIERLWRNVKYEKIYLNSYENGLDLMLALTEYFNFYNHDRGHQSLNYKTPAEIYPMNALTKTKKEMQNTGVFKGIVIKQKANSLTSLPLQNESSITS